MFDWLEHIKKYNFMNYPVLAYLYLWLKSYSESDFTFLILAVVFMTVGNLFVMYSTRNLVQEYHQGKLKIQDVNLVNISKRIFDLRNPLIWLMVVIYVVTFGFYLFSWINVYEQMIYPYGHIVFLIGLAVFMSFIYTQIFYKKESKKLYRWIRSYIRNSYQKEE